MAKKLPRLREIFEQEVTSALQEKFGYTSAMMIPKPVKVVLNVGAGNAPQNPKLLENALNDLEVVTGQKAVKTSKDKMLELQQGINC